MLNFIQQTLFSLPEVNQLKQIYMCKVHAVQYPDSAVVDSFEPCMSLQILFSVAQHLRLHARRRPSVHNEVRFWDSVVC